MKWISVESWWSGLVLSVSLVDWCGELEWITGKRWWSGLVLRDGGVD